MKNRYVSTFLIIQAALGFLFTGCTHDPHESISKPDTPGGTDTGYLATELAWEDASDSQNAVSYVQLLHTDADGTVSVDDFSSPQEMASQYSTLPSGQYTLLATVNITQGNGYRLDNLSTRAGSTDDIKLSLNDPGTPPTKQGWFGLSEITIEAGRLNIAKCLLQRAVSSISVHINDIPEGYAASIDVQRVADYISLNVKDDDGRHGVPSGTYSTVSLGSLAEDNDDNTSGSGVTKFMFPTATGFTRTYLDIHITTPSGNTLHSVADAPAMIMGYHYTVNLDYNKLSAYMYLDSYVINDWEEGWTVSGSILYPDEDTYTYDNK